MLQMHSFSGLGSSLPGCGLLFFINDLATKPGKIEGFQPFGPLSFLKTMQNFSTEK